MIECRAIKMLQDASSWLDEKPYKEIFDGRIHEKVSPKRTHGIVQGRIVSLLSAWGGGRGDIVVEWRVYLNRTTTLVPDVSFMSDERLRALSEKERETPPLAPELVVEIRSPDNRKRNILRKEALYLAHGAAAVLDIDPQARTIRVIDANGEVTLGPGDTFSHPTFPGLILAVDDVFAPLNRHRESV